MICSPGCNVLSVSASDLILDHFSVAANLQIPSKYNRVEAFPSCLVSDGFGEADV